MCRLGVHLEYGLTVKALSLIDVALGWKNSEPARIALDIICRRRNLGTLQVKFAPPTPQGVASSAIELVPIEVWQLVKQNLTASAARDAEQAGCRKVLDGSPCAHPHPDSPAECESCLDLFGIGDNLGKFLAARAYKHIDRLLADFRLERVKIGLVAGEDWVGSDLCAACTVAIRRDPSRPQRSLVQRFGDKCPNDLTQDGRVFSLERDALELPAAADAYFLRLFEHFPDLIVAQHPLLTPSPDLWPGALATGKSARLDAVVTHLARAELADNDKTGPGWMLCSDFELCW